MARPPKEGLDYFPHDTDAVNDEKIEALRALYGNDGYAFYFIMLERIYRSPESRLKVSAAETRQILAKKIDVPLEKFGKMLEFAVDLGCFDKRQYRKYGQITSNGIQKRAKPVIEKRLKLKEKYEQRKVSVAETPPETPQKRDKGKERKGKNIKEKNTANAVLFDKFWTVYPNKKNKGQAKKTWKKIKPDEELLNKMLTTIKRAKVSVEWTKDNGAFVPHPSTWLNAEGWDNEYMPSPEIEVQRKEYEKLIQEHTDKAEHYRNLLKDTAPTHARYNEFRAEVVKHNKAIRYYDKKLEGMR